MQVTSHCPVCDFYTLHVHIEGKNQEKFNHVHDIQNNIYIGLHTIIKYKTSLASQPERGSLSGYCFDRPWGSLSLTCKSSIRHTFPILQYLGIDLRVELHDVGVEKLTVNGVAIATTCTWKISACTQYIAIGIEHSYIYWENMVRLLPSIILLQATATNWLPVGGSLKLGFLTAIDIGPAVLCVVTTRSVVDTQDHAY